MKFINSFSRFYLVGFVCLLTACGGGGGGGSDDNNNSPNETEDGTEPFEMTMHSSKNVVKMILPNSISVDDEDEFDANDFAIIEKLYESFKDEFDFIFLVTNRSDNQTFPYSGRSTNGFFGVASRLKGYIHMTTNNGMKNGPTLHELGHNWTPHKGLWLYSGAGNGADDALRLAS